MSCCCGRSPCCCNVSQDCGCGRSPCCCNGSQDCSTLSFCNLLTLLAGWLLFDLLVCYFFCGVCEQICQCVSKVMLITWIVLTIFFFYVKVRCLFDFMNDLPRFKQNVEQKLSNIECKLLVVGAQNDVPRECRPDDPRVQVSCGTFSQCRERRTR
uniref:Uncharacterized protein n=1 Tax=Cacopsylla melanoneura TaxID=428564 RepID=A0A8D8SGB7_9HEMI